MSTIQENSQSINDTRQFLFDLLDPKKTEKVPKNIRERAARHIKHFPYFDFETYQKCHDICAVIYIARNITLNNEKILECLKQIDILFREENVN